jgi:hypothetical protein
MRRPHPLVTATRRYTPNITRYIHLRAEHHHQTLMRNSGLNAS